MGTLVRDRPRQRLNPPLNFASSHIDKLVPRYLRSIDYAGIQLLQHIQRSEMDADRRCIRFASRYCANRYMFVPSARSNGLLYCSVLYRRRYVLYAVGIHDNEFL